MNQLKNIRAFSGAGESTLKELWSAGKVVQYEKGAVCFTSKEKNEVIYFLVDGIASVYNLTYCGKKKTIFFLGAGELLNDCITPGAVMSVNCNTMKKSRIFVIRANVLQKLMAKDFGLTQSIMMELERKIWRMGHQLKNTMGSIYMERKLAAKLWKLGRDFGKLDEKGLYIDIPLSITELADFLGAPRETTSRIFKLLCSYGMVEMCQKRIYILEPEKLRAFYKGLGNDSGRD